METSQFMPDVCNTWREFSETPEIWSNQLTVCAHSQQFTPFLQSWPFVCGLLMEKSYLIACQDQWTFCVLVQSSWAIKLHVCVYPGIPKHFLCLIFLCQVALTQFFTLNMYTIGCQTSSPQLTIEIFSVGLPDLVPHLWNTYSYFELQNVSLVACCYTQNKDRLVGQKKDTALW